MGKEIRKTGIEIIDNAPWGTHFCVFYKTKEDLIEILVPYFKTGLENNEFCLWITSEPLNEKEAQEAIKKAMTDFDQYLKRRQIEIIPHTQWYLKSGAFDSKKVFKMAADKLKQVQALGYKGVRGTGNTSWLGKKDWKSLADYEEKVNSLIGQFPVIALCAYPLDKCGSAEVIDVVSNHGFALIRRSGKWELIESSEHKRAEEALKESELQLKKLFKLSPVAIIISAVDGKIEYANKAAYDMTGYQQNEAIGMATKEFFVDPKERDRSIKVIKKHGQRLNYDFHYKRKDGTTGIAIANSKLIDLGRGPRLVIKLNDITERKQTEEELKKARANVERKVKEATYQLKKQHQAQQNFFIDLAHELKTPLTFMKGSFDLALRKTAEKIRKDSKSFTRFLTAQKEEVDRIEKVVNDLSTLAKADTQQLIFQFKKIKLDKLIEKVCLRLQKFAKQEKKKLVFKKLMPLIVMGDQERLEQLISNLLDNAIKFTKAGSGQIQVSLTTDRGRAKIRIKDNGIGITQEDLPYIFERFYRSANTKHNPKLRGSGLGLAICEWIVKKHHGKITAESTKKKGTVFTVLLPLRKISS